MFPKPYYAQRKRKFESSSNYVHYPNRLLLGGMLPAGGRGAGRGRGGGGRGAAPAFAGNALRVGTHINWNMRNNVFNGHFQENTAGVPGRNPPTRPIPNDFNQGRISHWEEDLVGLAPFGTENDWLAIPYPAGMGPPQTAFRMGELLRLRVRGILHDLFLAGGVRVRTEPLWGFMGMANSMAYGLAWSCFHYALSDLHAPPTAALSEWIISIPEILTDIMLLTNGGVTPAMRVMLHFEGQTTDPTIAARQYINCTSAGYFVGALIVNPVPIFDQIANYFTSDHTFVPNRVYIHVLTNLDGGGLRCMPESWKKIRDGPHFKEIKGVSLIDDVDDGSCGIEAVIWSISNTMRRIHNNLRKAQKIAIPEIVKRFDNYRRGKLGTLSNKSRLTHSETFKELASYIGWKKGQYLTNDNICDMVNEYAKKNDLDIGVLILNAMQPLTIYQASYFPEKQPSEVIVLLHWQFPVTINGFHSQSGHYDCINPSNVTKFISARLNLPMKRKDKVYSFKEFKLLSSSQADNKGLYCHLCKHWQKKTTLEEWNSKHGGGQRINTFLCTDCNVRFRSQVCAVLHTKKQNRNATIACESQSECKECKQVHKNEFSCNEKFCKICFTKYLKTEERQHVCFMGCVGSKKKKRIRNVIYADMEAGRMHGFHEGVCVAAKWSCLCNDHAKALRKKKCKACKEHHDSWGYFCKDCASESESDPNDCKECHFVNKVYFFGKDCVKVFMEWVMNEHMGSTVVFHNGGKYDFHILYTHLFENRSYVVSMDAMRASQIIFLVATKVGTENSKKPQQVRFIDSINFIPAGLRAFPKMFGLKESGEKDRFPYDFMLEPGFENYEGKVPDKKFFGILDIEIELADKLSSTRRKEVKEILEYIDTENRLGKVWKTKEKLEVYTLQDVQLLHDGCELFRYNFWLLSGCDPFQWVTMPSAVAGAYRQPQFMPEKSIQIFKPKDREFQRNGLRGGRTEPFMLYWRKTKPEEFMEFVDVNSEYPYVQAYGFYPEGAVSFDKTYPKPVSFLYSAVEFYAYTGVTLYDVLHDPSGKTGTGIIECDIESSVDTYYPYLPCRIEMGKNIKNIFMNRNGKFIGFITLLAAGIVKNQYIIKTVTRIQYWKNTTDKLFKKYLTTLYAQKLEASGWDKIFNDEPYDEEKCRTFHRESALRGIQFDYNKVKDNPGLRAVAKIMCNCGWGYMCQKPHLNENHYFDNTSKEDIEEMGNLIGKLDSEADPTRMVGQPVSIGGGNYTRIKTAKDPSDMTEDEMNKKVAYHVGGQVPTYGCQLITDAINSLAPDQPVYTDTDSLGFIKDRKKLETGEHKDIKTGYFLGDFANEYPNSETTEFVSTGPKSYYMKVEHKSEKIAYKGRFKGLSLNSGTYSLKTEDNKIAEMGLKEMKLLLWDAIRRKFGKDDKKIDIDTEEISEKEDLEALTFKFHYLNIFKRSADFKIKAVEEEKTVRFTFDKRDILIPKNYKTGLDLTPKEIWDLDPSDEKVGEKMWDIVKEIRTKPKTEPACVLTKEEISKWWESVNQKTKNR